MKINKISNDLSGFTDWWFAGVLVVIYWTGKNVFLWSDEIVEWQTFLLSFVIALLMFCLTYNNWPRTRTAYKYLFLIPLLFLIAQEFEPSISHLIFLIGSGIIAYGSRYILEDNSDKKQFILNVIFYFVMFHLSSKLVYWRSFDDFIWRIVPKKSSYHEYAQIIELTTPILVIVIFFVAVLIMLFSLKNDFEVFARKFYWWVIPFSVFFIESFSTAGFFDKVGGGAMFHWQPYVGVIEMMQQDGLLLWDTPPHYGYLSMITAYLIPVSDAWQKMYILNGVLRLVMGLIVFFTIWNKRGVLWYTLSITLTLAFIYYLPGGQILPNSAEAPSIGAMRYIWVVVLLFLIVKLRKKNLKFQVIVFAPIWLIGVLWSIGSAISVTAVLGPFVLHYLFIDPKKTRNDLISLMSFPIMLFASLSIITIYYQNEIGHYPDFYSFFQLAVSASQGFYAEPFSDKLPYFILVIILSWLISKMISEKEKYVYFSLWLGLWSVFSRYIGQSNSVNLMAYIGMSVFVIFLAIDLFEEKKKIKTIYQFSPILIIVLTMTYGNPHVIKHIYNSFTNQDYTLIDTRHNEIDDLHYILTKINPKDTPVAYIEHGRYLNYLSKNRYTNKNTNETITLSDDIWIPLRPAELYVGLTFDRRVEYYNRWLERHPYEKGWVISSIEEYWHKNVSDALRKALKNYKVVKHVEYGVLKADLYSKI